MSIKMYLFKTEIFYDKTTNFQYLLHTLFLQNCEYLLKNGLSLSTFLEFVDFLVFVEAEKFSKSGDFSSNNQKFSQNQPKIKKFFESLSKIKKTTDFYEFLQQNSAKIEFCEIFQIIIQRLLLVLMVDLKPHDFMTKKLVSAIDSLKKNEINMEEILVLSFLRFINKNCKIIVETKNLGQNHCFKIDEKLPYLFLFLDEHERLVFVSLEKESSDYFEKKKINENKNTKEKEKIHKNYEEEEISEKSNRCFLKFLQRLTKKLENIKEFNEKEIKTEFLEKTEELKKRKKEKLCKTDYDELKAKLKEFVKKMDKMKFNTLKEVNNFLFSFE